MSNALSAKDVIECIYRKAPYLTRALRQIAEYILEHPDQYKTLTIKDLATASNVAESLNPCASAVVSASAPTCSRIGRNQSIARGKIKIRPGK